MRWVPKANVSISRVIPVYWGHKGRDADSHNEDEAWIVNPLWIATVAEGSTPFQVHRCCTCWNRELKGGR